MEYFASSMARLLLWASYLGIHHSRCGRRSRNPAACPINYGSGHDPARRRTRRGLLLRDPLGRAVPWTCCRHSHLQSQLGGGLHAEGTGGVTAESLIAVLRTLHDDSPKTNAARVAIMSALRVVWATSGCCAIAGVTRIPTSFAECPTLPEDSDGQRQK